MKKAVLGVAVVIIVAIYSLHERLDGSTAVVLPSKKSTAASQTVVSSQTQPNQSSATSGSTGSSSATAGKYKDGTYDGSVEDAFYGNVQVEIVVRGGRLTSVNFLQYPNDRSTSRMINSQAMPLLQQEAISAQSAQVDTVSGATDTSMAFVQSLTAALSHAA